MGDMKLFIDDIRIPSDVGLVNSEYCIARNWWQAVNIIMFAKPQEIHFDHDLGEESDIRTGYGVAKFLIEEDMFEKDDFITKDFVFRCHSANPVGKKNIEELLNGYIQSKFS